MYLFLSRSILQRKKIQKKLIFLFNASYLFQSLMYFLITLQWVCFLNESPTENLFRLTSLSSFRSRLRMLRFWKDSVVMDLLFYYFAPLCYVLLWISFPYLHIQTLSKAEQVSALFQTRRFLEVTFQVTLFCNSWS